MGTGYFILTLFITVLISFFSAQDSTAMDCTRARDLSREASLYLASSPARAEKKLHMALELCGRSASLRYNLAVALYNQGRNNAAAAQLEDAIELRPDFAEALNNLAFIYLKKGGTYQKRALELAERAVALNPENNEYRDTLARASDPLLAIDVDTPPKTGIKRPDAIAVVIGNKSYRNDLIPDVDYAVRDAEIVRQYLVNTMGFSYGNIIFLQNADKMDFEMTFGNENNHIGDLYTKIKRKRSDIFIYYSGHGAPDINLKKAMLIPSNANPDHLNFSGYSLDTLYRNLFKLNKEKEVKSITVVLDTCFSGGYNDGSVISGASPIYLEVKNPVLSTDNSVVFTSSRGNQVSSWFRDKKHGLFTFFFLKAIKEQSLKNSEVTVRDIETALLGEDSVNDYAMRLYRRKQEPVIIGNKNLVLVRQR